MREVKLYGHLGEQFGRSFMLDVRSPAEAVAALRANLQGFSEALVNHLPGYHVFVGKQNVGRDDLTFQSANAPIKIVPYVAGAKAGMFQTILGAVLVVVGAYFEQPWLVQMGGAMIIGGISQMLFAPPTPGATKNGPGNDPSYSFNGPVNTTAQGNCVPVCYGHLIVGSQVISAGLSVEQLMTPPPPVTASPNPATGLPSIGYGDFSS